MIYITENVSLIPNWLMATLGHLAIIISFGAMLLFFVAAMIGLVVMMIKGLGS